MFIPEGIARILQKLEDNGYEAYVVGGAVRDLLLGKTPDDVDIVTVARPQILAELFDDWEKEGGYAIRNPLLFNSCLISAITFGEGADMV